MLMVFPHDTGLEFVNRSTSRHTALKGQQEIDGSAAVDSMIVKSLFISSFPYQGMHIDLNVKKRLFIYK